MVQAEAGRSEVEQTTGWWLWKLNWVENEKGWDFWERGQSVLFSVYFDKHLKLVLRTASNDLVLRKWMCIGVDWDLSMSFRFIRVLWDERELMQRGAAFSLWLVILLLACCLRTPFWAMAERLWWALPIISCLVGKSQSLTRFWKAVTKQDHLTYLSFSTLGVCVPGGSL